MDLMFLLTILAALAVESLTDEEPMCAVYEVCWFANRCPLSFASSALDRPITFIFTGFFVQSRLFARYSVTVG